MYRELLETAHRDAINTTCCCYLGTPSVLIGWRLPASFFSVGLFILCAPYVPGLPGLQALALLAPKCAQSAFPVEVMVEALRLLTCTDLFQGVGPVHACSQPCLSSDVQRRAASLRLAKTPLSMPHVASLRLLPSGDRRSCGHL